jgi:hypothetical protein
MEMSTTIPDSAGNNSASRPKDHSKDTLSMSISDRLMTPTEWRMKQASSIMVNAYAPCHHACAWSECRYAFQLFSSFFFFFFSKHGLLERNHVLRRHELRIKHVLSSWCVCMQYRTMHPLNSIPPAIFYVSSKYLLMYSMHAMLER